jgi:hypothetical protein
VLLPGPVNGPGFAANKRSGVDTVNSKAFPAPNYREERMRKNFLQIKVLR